jgi:hypothetical protein
MDIFINLVICILNDYSADIYGMSIPKLYMSMKCPQLVQGSYSNDKSGSIEAVIMRIAEMINMIGQILKIS